MKPYYTEKAAGSSKCLLTGILAALLLLPLFSCAQSDVPGDTFRLFYLGGQSNMDGYGYTKDLPDSLDKTFKDVWIFHGNSAKDDTTSGGRGIWAPLKPGHGAGFSSDGKTNSLSNRFGIELSFASQMRRLYPDAKIALIKYSKGGSSIDSVAARNFGCWEPDYGGKQGLNQYDHFLKTMRTARATSDINGDGKRDKLRPTGIIWMQGESDADYTEAVAKRYCTNLKRLMDLLRATLYTDDLPVVIGKISDSWNDKEDNKVWEYCDLVQHAQEKYVRNDANAAIVRQTRYYNYSDPWHYDSAGFIDLGYQFAQKLHKLIKTR